jgi:uncharacterized protein (DUF4415 family)
MNHLIGDKISIKGGPQAGKRGLLLGPSSRGWQARLSDSNQRVIVATADFVNYSLAARKAWIKMPNRMVGRPVGTRVSDRVSVTVRVDRDLWRAFQQAEEAGKIVDRTATINGILRDFIQELDRSTRKLHEIKAGRRIAKTDHGCAGLRR